jgi:hypothetical protein
MMYHNTAFLSHRCKSSKSKTRSNSKQKPSRSVTQRKMVIDRARQNIDNLQTELKVKALYGEKAIEIRKNYLKRLNEMVLSKKDEVEAKSEGSS